MITLKILAVLFAVLVGIPNVIIDHKHRKQGGYKDGNAWAYYSKLSKEGNREGRFMMWSGYLSVYLVIAALCYGFYALTR